MFSQKKKKRKGNHVLTPGKMCIYFLGLAPCHRSSSTGSPLRMNDLAALGLSRPPLCQPLSQGKGRAPPALSPWGTARSSRLRLCDTTSQDALGCSLWEIILNPQSRFYKFCQWNNKKVKGPTNRFAEGSALNTRFLGS